MYRSERLDRLLLNKNLTLFTSPIKFKFTAAGNGSASNPNPPTPPPAPPRSGSVKFTLVNYRKPVKFLYITGNLQYPQVVAETKTVTYKYPNRPTGVHIAFGHGGSNMWLLDGRRRTVKTGDEMGFSW